MKLCVDCIHYGDHRRCYNPTWVSPSPVDGVRQPLSCETLRSPIGNCGPKAFGHSERPASSLRKLFGRQ